MCKLGFNISARDIVETEVHTGIKSNEVSLEDVTVDKFYAINSDGYIGHIVDNGFSMNQVDGGSFLEYYKGMGIKDTLRTLMKNHTVVQFDTQLEFYKWCVGIVKLYEDKASTKLDDFDEFTWDTPTVIERDKS